MNSHSKPVIKSRAAIRSITEVALCAALLLVLQVALAGLPNVELVSLLVCLYTLTFKRRVLPIIYVFVLVEGLIYGFSLWWVGYLYIWTILSGVTWLLRRMESVWGWALLCGGFGLLFGAFCSIPFLIIDGPAMALSAWVSGIGFDLVHGTANFALCILLWRPLRSILQRYARD